MASDSWVVFRPLLPQSGVNFPDVVISMLRHDSMALGLLALGVPVVLLFAWPVRWESAMRVISMAQEDLFLFVQSPDIFLGGAIRHLPVANAVSDNDGGWDLFPFGILCSGAGEFHEMATLSANSSSKVVNNDGHLPLLGLLVSRCLWSKATVIVVRAFLDDFLSWCLLLKSLSSFQFQLQVLLGVVAAKLLGVTSLEPGLDLWGVSEWGHGGHSTNLGRFWRHRVRRYLSLLFDSFDVLRNINSLFELLSLGPFCGSWRHCSSSLLKLILDHAWNIWIFFVRLSVKIVLRHGKNRHLV